MSKASADKMDRDIGALNSRASLQEEDEPA